MERMEDCVIPGNNDLSDEEIVNNWDSKTSRMIMCKLCVCKNEKVLEDVLTDYVWKLERQALSFKMKKLLQQKILKHVMVFYSCCLSISNIPSDMQCYWEKMETVLSILCNLELDLTKNFKCSNNKEYNGKVEEITTRLVYILSVFLLNDNQKICHVLLKLDVKHNSKQWKDVMRGVYRHFLIMMPIKDKSDENFCRIYLLFECFKTTVSKKNHKAMDALLFSSFGRTPDSIKKNRTLKKILSPSTNSIIDLIDMLSDYRQISIDSYFKHIDDKNKEEDLCIPSSINLESDSEEDFVEVVPTVQNLVILVDDDVVKLEDDDHVIQASNAFINGIICLDDDDDSDVEEVSLSVEPNTNIKSLNAGSLSFLESIQIPGEIISSLETPPSSAEMEHPLVIDEPLDQIEETSTTLPFIDCYLDNLRIQGHVIDVNPTNSSESNTNNIEDVIHSNAANEQNECEVVSANQVESESISTAEIRNDNVENNNAQCALCIGNEEQSEISLSNGIQTNLTKRPPETTEESSLLILHEDKESDNFVDNINSCADQFGKTTEKPLDSPSNGYTFNLIHGLITPPVSDRTNDDVVSDLNPSINCAENVYVPNIIRIEPIPYDQFETNNCSRVEKSLCSDGNVEEDNNEENINDFIESQEELEMDTDENLVLHESIDIQESEVEQYNNSSVIDDSTIFGTTEDLQTNVELEEANHIIFNQINTEQEIVESLTPVDIIEEDYQLPSNDIISSNHNIFKSFVTTRDSPVITSKNFLDGASQKHNFQNTSTFANSVLSSTLPLFSSILKTSNKNSPILTDHQFNLKHTPKINGNIAIISKPPVSIDKSKIIFTSSERVSAPLSVFSKFEQAQSELIEKACSGPIEPINTYSNMHSDHSNSNESLYSPQLRQPIPADSPISPPYEQIQAQDYENHVRNVKYTCVLNPDDPAIPKTSRLNDKHKELHLNEIPTTSNATETTNSPNRKRKHDDTPQQPKRNKVNFGGTEIRLIPPENSRLIQQDVLIEANDSMKKYNIHMNDVKLVYLQPQIPVKIESLSELQEKEEQLKIRGLLHSTTVDKLNGGDSTCIVKRVDYNKIAEQMNSAVTSHSEIRHKISNLISKQQKNTRLENPVPSTYVPPLNGYSPGFRYNYETMAINNTAINRNYRSGVHRMLHAVHNDVQTTRSRGTNRKPKGRPKKMLDPFAKGTT